MSSILFSEKLYPTAHGNREIDAYAGNGIDLRLKDLTVEVELLRF